MNTIKIDNIRVLLIDDHQIYLDGLEMMLNQALPSISVSKSDNVNDAESKILENEDFDLILLDLKLNDQDGFDLCAMESFKNKPIAILSATECPQDILKAKTLGILGFLSKGASNKTLIKNIELLLEGECIFPVLGLKSKLTPRQYDVLQLLAEGYPNKLICKKLTLTEATVKTHLRTLFSLLNVNTRTQCVNVARQQHLI